MPTHYRVRHGGALAWLSPYHKQPFYDDGTPMRVRDRTIHPPRQLYRSIHQYVASMKALYYERPDVCAELATKASRDPVTSTMRAHGLYTCRSADWDEALLYYMKNAIRLIMMANPKIRHEIRTLEFPVLCTGARDVWYNSNVPGTQANYLTCAWSFVLYCAGKRACARPAPSTASVDTLAEVLVQITRALPPTEDYKSSAAREGTQRALPVSP